MTTRSVHDATIPPGSPVRLDVTLASTPEASAALETGAALEASAAYSADAERPADAVPAIAIAYGATPQEAAAPPDTTRYDSAWASTEMPTKEPQGFEQFMVGGGKMYVVLAVVLIIWIGLLAFLFSTDRRIRSLERDAD